MEKQLLLILNPIAGRKKAMPLLPQLVELFTQAGYRVQICVTRQRGDARRAAKKFGKDMDLLVCCGGDGTLNEVATGLMQAGLQKPIGYIPTGSTNDFANTLQLSDDPMTAARQILCGTIGEYDLGRFGNHYFNYVASFGAFTATSYSCSQVSKNLFGHFAYILGALLELPSLHKEHIRMIIDGEPLEGDYLFGAVCNTTSVAGVVTLKPELVDLQDGLFEVILVRAPHSPGELVQCIKSLLNHSLQSDMITLRSGARVEVFANEHMDWSLDGEQVKGRDRWLIENLHKKLWIKH